MESECDGEQVYRGGKLQWERQRVSFFHIICIGKNLRTCLLAGCEISESQAELSPSYFPLTLVVASPDLVERWVVHWTAE